MRRSILLREKKRKIFNKNKNIKNKFSLLNLNDKKLESFEFLKLGFQKQIIKRDLFKNRVNNRCFVTGRSRSFYRFFGLSRHSLKELFNLNVFSGLRKSCW